MFSRVPSSCCATCERPSALRAASMDGYTSGGRFRITYNRSSVRSASPFPLDFICSHCSGVTTHFSINGMLEKLKNNLRGRRYHASYISALLRNSCVCTQTVFRFPVMALVGKWEYVSAENLDEYMTVAAVPDNLKEVAKNSKPSLEITNSGDQWTLKTTVSDKVKDTTFTLGQEFETKSLTGQDLKCVVTMEGEKMVETQKAGDVTTIVTREVQGDQLVSKMTLGGSTATVTFKRA
ncbi:FABP4-like protein [Mya arenaria]|uniref:FABP4-like protein n=2 Tax=Mya arenaria TaxID=6604 RepID=A0ABY7E489_MYAAR|nr:FABP4-like protein [Mya arenaria]